MKGKPVKVWYFFTFSRDILLMFEYYTFFSITASMNWFKSIQGKYAADEEDLLEKKKAQEVKRNAKIAASKQTSWFSTAVEDNTQEEDDEMTILHMMQKRIEGNRREMAMLFFSMNGAQSFFKEARARS